MTYVLETQQIFDPSNLNILNKVNVRYAFPAREGTFVVIHTAIMQYASSIKKICKPCQYYALPLLFAQNVDNSVRVCKDVKVARHEKGPKSEPLKRVKNTPKISKCGYYSGGPKSISNRFANWSNVRTNTTRWLATFSARSAKAFCFGDSTPVSVLTSIHW